MEKDLHTPRERAESWLKASGLRPTKQRLLLAELLIGDGENRHVTAEMLHREAPDVALATVYNTLNAFCDAGLVREISVEGSRSFFDTRTDSHSHFHWHYSDEHGEQIADIPGQLRIEDMPEPPDGMEIADIDVIVRLRPKG
ncbi:iron response transcriptional regulator IrrA [Paracoccaceae bacterium GXU_MW_L88]